MRTSHREAFGVQVMSALLHTVPDAVAIAASEDSPLHERLRSLCTDATMRLSTASQHEEAAIAQLACAALSSLQAAADAAGQAPASAARAQTHALQAQCVVLVLLLQLHASALITDAAHVRLRELLPQLAHMTTDTSAPSLAGSHQAHKSEQGGAGAYDAVAPGLLMFCQVCTPVSRSTASR
jgi:hypothetical protein